MQRNTNLGMSLGSLLSSMFDGTAKQKGVFDAQTHNADIGYKNANAEKARVETAAKQQEIDNSSDSGLAKSLIAGLQNGINGDNVSNDFNAYLKGEYKPREQQGAMMPQGSYMPTPEYVSKFPELQQKFSGLKQMLALGDKNLSNLSKSIQGDQRNAITKDLGTATPEQAAEIGMRTSAIEGNVNPLEMMKAALVHGLTNGKNTTNAQNALLLSQGKTRYDNMGGTGTFDLLTGNQSLNELGTSGVNKNNASATESLAGAVENKAQANQANAGASENIAQAGLANERTKGIKNGKGDGSNQFKVDGSYQSALGIPAIDEKGLPISDPFSGRQIINRNPKEEENFLKWASDNKYNSTDAALGSYIAKGRPRATTIDKPKSPAYQEYVTAFNAEKDPVRRKRMTDFARSKGLVK